MSLSQWQKGTGAFDAKSFGGQLAIKGLSLDLSGATAYAEGGIDCDIAAFYNGRKHAALIAPKGGYTFEYDPATGKVKVYDSPGAGASETVQMIDDDSASSNGTALYVVPDNGRLAHFESTTDNDSDSTFETAEGGVAVVIDNDSPGGVQVYFNEEGDEGARFLASTPTGADLYVPISSGKYIKITHDASASSNGVAVYFDDDGATVDERLLFVSGDDADSSEITTGGEVMPGTDLSDLDSIDILAFGLLS